MPFFPLVTGKYWNGGPHLLLRSFPLRGFRIAATGGGEREKRGEDEKIEILLSSSPSFSLGRAKKRKGGGKAVH